MESRMQRPYGIKDAKTLLNQGCKDLMESRMQRPYGIKDAKSTMLLAIPDEHLLKFHGIKDAKTLWEAIKTRFGGNKESKKMQKTILKQQYENFAASRSEGLDKIYDRSLPSAWNNIALIMRNKSDLDTLSMDELYNNLKVYEAEIKGQSSSSSNAQNVAFVSSENTSSTNEAFNTAHDVSTASSLGQASSSTYADDVMFSFFANQSNSPQLDNEDLEQIDTDDFEEMDLKWQVAMLTIRVKRFIKKTGRNLIFNGKETVRLDKTKVECYNCHRRGHFARECRAPRNQGNRNGDNARRVVPVETPANALVVTDEMGYDWSYQAKEGPTYFALMAHSSSGSSSLSSSDTEVNTCSKECYQMGLESLEARIVVHEMNEVVYEENIVFLKYDVQVKDISVKDLKKQLEEALKEKDDLRFKLENFEELSKNLTKLINSQISAKDKIGFGYDGQMNKSELNNIKMNESEMVHSVFNSRESDEDDNPVNDRFKIGEGFHTVPPPYTGNYMPPRPDLSFAGLDDYESDSDDDCVIRPSADQTKPKFTKINFVKSGENVKFVNKENTYRQAEYPRKSQSPRSNRRNLNGMMTQKLRNGFEFIKEACFVCGSFNHLIKDYDFHDNKMVEKLVLNKNGRVTSQREIRPVWNNAQRVNHKNKLTHPHPKRNFVPAAVLTKSGQVPVNAAKFNNVTTAGPKAVVSAAVGDRENSGNPQYALQDQGIFDNGCSRHITGNKFYLFDYQDIDGGFVAFAGSTKGGKITRKGKIKIEKLNFEDVYFVKATIDESNLWHRRLGHINFKTMNKLVRGNLVRGFPSKLFKNDHTCVACQKGKQHKASFLITKPHNKTPYELLIGRPPNLDFMRPFGCPVTILNTLDHLGKFEGKADEGLLVGYSVNSKAFRVFNTRTRKVEENLHIKFLENKSSIAGSGPEWLFDIDSLTKSMNYEPVTAGNQTNDDAGIKTNVNARQAGQEKASAHEYILLPFMPSNSPLSSSTQSSEDKDTDEVPGKGNDGVSKGDNGVSKGDDGVSNGDDDQENTDSST
ncbi:ribonuclease H-like domain-containing protein [Tanacetum coccineum]